MNRPSLIVYFYDLAEGRMPANYSSGRTVFPESARNRASGSMLVACPSDSRSANSALGFAFLELGDPLSRLDQTAEDAPQRLVGQLLQASFEIIQFIGWFLDTGTTCFQLPRNHPANRVPAELDFFDTAVFCQPAVALIVCSQITDVKNIVTQQSDQPEPPPQIVLDTFANTLFAMCRRVAILRSGCQVSPDFNLAITASALPARRIPVVPALWSDAIRSMTFGLRQISFCRSFEKDTFKPVMLSQTPPRLVS